MDRELLKKLLSEGEGERVEFKKELSKKERGNMAKEMAAFANAQGGWIIFGVEDDGRIVGVEDISQLEETLMNLASHNVTPPIIPGFFTFEVEGKKLAVVEIPQGENKPYRPFYIRRGSTKRELSIEELRRLYQERQLVSFDRSVIEESSLDDLDPAKFERYLFLVAGKRPDDFPISKENLLVNKQVIAMRKGRFRVTIAGMLLFGREPQRFVPQSEISCARFKGLDMGNNFIDRKDFRGTLDELIEQTVAFIERHSSLNATIGRTRRIETPEYHPQVVREFVINAVAHRDYSLRGSRIRIFMFDDRLEIISPGGLPNTVTFDSLFTGVHYSRNQLIFEFLHAMGYGERMGTGIPRTFKFCREGGYPEPDIVVSENQVRVVLPSRFFSQD